MLDLNLTNMHMTDTPLVLPPIGLSDHKSVLYSYEEGTTKNIYTKVKIRQKNNATKTAFGKWLTVSIWTALYRIISGEQKLNPFQDILNVELDCFFRLRL